MAQRAALCAAALAALVGPEARAQAVEHPFSFSLLPGRVPALELPTLALGDVDGDGDLDLLAMGVRLDGAARSTYSALLRNDGPVDDPIAPAGRSIAFTALPLPVALAHGDLDLGDLDRDGDLDLVVTGSRTHLPPYQPQTHLYRNDGGTFVDTGIALPAVFGGAARLADVDGDGDLDLVLTGAAEASGPYTPTARVLRQTGAWTFADAGASGLPGHAFGEMRVVDGDGDGDLDVLLGGVTPEGLATRLYLNTAGTFAASPLALPAGTLVRLDAVRRDARLDIAVSVGTLFPIGLDGHTELLLGVSSGTPAVQQVLGPAVGGYVRFTDYDDDGDNDLLVDGAAPLNWVPRTWMLRHSGAATFELAGHLEGVSLAQSALGDLDGDGDVDVVASGTLATLDVAGLLYRNDRWGRATTPSQPRGLGISHADDGTVLLTWDPVPGAASYDVRIGTTPGAIDVLAPYADARGRRTRPLAGVVSTPSFPLSTNLLATSDRLYASVQAVSASHVGSSFSEALHLGETATRVEAPVRVTNWALGPPSPMPMRTRGQVHVQAPNDGPVTLDVVDGLGRVAVRLYRGPLAAGDHALDVNVQDLAAGVYALRLSAPGGVQTRLLIVSP